MPQIIHKGIKPAGFKPAPAPVQSTAKPAPAAVKPGPVAAPTTGPKLNGAKPAPAAPAAGAKPGLKFLKRGAAAQQVFAQEEKKAEMRKKDLVFRFFIPENVTGDITFLDGNLKDGVLDVPFYHEHNVHMNGKWNNFFICTQDEEPCPVCEGGSAPAYVGILTIIDHSEYTSKKDGKSYKDNLRLFVAKRDTIKLLQDMAVKRGGLRGCRYEVKRIGDKSPAVGSHFDFTEKITEQQLKAKYGQVKQGEKMVDHSKPINYDQYLGEIYQPAAELRKIGFGDTTGIAPVGSEAGAEEENYQM